MRSVNARFAIVSFLVISFLAGYFFDCAFTPNPTSRLLPVLTVVEDRTLQIDRWKDWTQDKAFVNGHYYGDKAPLSSIVVIPFYAAYRAIFNPVPKPYPSYAAFSLGNILCGILPFVFLIGVIFQRLSHEGRHADAVLLSTLPVFGSFLAGYSGTFFGHLLAGALILGAWICVRDPQRTRPILAGALSGLAFLAEFPMALFAVVFFAHLAFKSRSIRACIRFALACLPFISFFLLYNFWTTGDPLVSPYRFPADPSFAAMEKAYGFSLPKLEAVWGMALGLSRGALIYAPALLYIAYLSIRKFIAKELRPNWVLFSGFLIFYLVISSYHMWWGGWSYGPRHLIPPMFVIFYEGITLIGLSMYSRLALYGLSSVGIALAWLAKSTKVFMIPEKYDNPVFQFLLPEFLEGKINADNLMSLWFGVPPFWASLFWIPLFSVSIAALHLSYRKQIR